jgi:hypothetical protein
MSQKQLYYIKALEALMCKTNNFIIEDELSFLKIGTAHNTKRLISMMSNMIRNPGKSILSQSSSRTEAKAAYQLLNNRNLNFQEVDRIHNFKTIERIMEYGKPILLIQDTTHVNYNSQSKKEKLGMIHENVKGVKIHTCIATTTDGLTLGVLNQSNHSSDPLEDESLSKYQKKLRPIEEKESYRWIKSFRESTVLIPEDTDVTIISDREGDIYEYMIEVDSHKRYYLTRIAQNRMTIDNQKIFDAIRQEKCQGVLGAKVPRNSAKSIESREIKLEIRFSKFEIKRPDILKNNHKLPLSHTAYVIHAREIKPPTDKEPVEWFLMTNRPVNNFNQAMIQIKNYVQRWKIERFHYVLKSGGCNIEKIQARSMEVTLSLIMLYSIIAIFIMNLTYAARLTPDRPCSDFFDKEEWQFLYCMVNRPETIPDKPYSIKEAVKYIAQIGAGRRAPSDGPPGAKVVWEGLEKLYLLMQYTEEINYYGSLKK